MPLRLHVVLLATTLTPVGAIAQGMSALSPAQVPAAASPEPVSDYDRIVAAMPHADSSAAEDLLTRAVTLKAAETGQSPVEAKFAVYRDFAHQAAAVGDFPLAVVFATNALKLAQGLENAESIVETLSALTDYFEEAGRLDNALDAARSAWQIALRLKRPVTELQALGLRAADLAGRSARPPDELDAIYTRLLELPGIDHLSIELQRAENDDAKDPAAFNRRWEHIAQLARLADAPLIQARAQDKLGTMADDQGEATTALKHFAQAAALASPGSRDWMALARHARLLQDSGRPAEARQLLERAVAERPVGVDSGGTVQLLDDLAGLQAAAGDLPAANTTLKRTLQLVQQRGYQPAFLDFAPTAHGSQTVDELAAADLAAVRNALREAELDRTRLRQRQTVGIAISAALLAGLLGLAYLYKRRTAATESLRAENAELTALRYQLNPHFLFNALGAVSGQMLSDVRGARDALGRLAEFCERVLRSPDERITTVAAEAALLESFLAVARVSANGDLDTSLVVDPELHHHALAPMLLQPLVENAIKYATPGPSGRRTVAVRIAPGSTGGLHVVITNSGPWREPDSGAPPRRRIGLANVRTRLAKLHPTHPDSLRIEKSGTAVTLHLTLPTN